MYTTRKDEKWLYWFRRTAESEPEYYANRVVKFPARTAEWRMLQAKMSADGLDAIGYVRIGMTDNAFQYIKNNMI